MKKDKGISEHFRRESKIMLWFVLAVLLVGLITAIALPRVATVIEAERTEAR